MFCVITVIFDLFNIKIKLFFIVFAMFIVSCSYYTHDVCSVNGDEYYLKTDPLYSIIVPDNMVLSLVDKGYDIPDIFSSDNLKIGKDLDICPPYVLY